MVRRFNALLQTPVMYNDCTLSVGAWLSLVEHSVRDRGVGGSNPLAPTIFLTESSKFSQPGHSVPHAKSTVGTEWPVPQIRRGSRILRYSSIPSFPTSVP